ncbi:MAG: HAD-IC family P-type ATPase [Candidatus Korarchaeota archaeon]|nr:HAD-IC family P-type ATPase [Candidatus Korarchaeota archaeon]NIU82997.1 HAD-IC family P-type ATPase [Candidatus Thorarchaeota archaeon]NIW14228.1 HAD-IC family P-type ATPase [Candidatus Thorarchaeota archaeon]NIW51540.1 HAD-IC family P-type ATPase [Candidatus Korarchaeota archaeon]
MESRDIQQLEAHSVPAKEVLQHFDSSEEGLSQQEAKKRLKKYGMNKIEREKGISPVQIFLSEFNDPLVLLLIGSLAISALIQHFTDAIVIGIIVVANGIIGFVQEFRAEKSLEALKEMLEPTAIVIREGHKQEISAEEIVPGDVISLEPGDRVPADARLITQSGLETQEAPLTGESTPVGKEAETTLPSDAPVAERRNTVFMGTTVTKGVGKAVVSATGMNSEFGSIAHEVQRVKKEETPLMRRIGKFGKRLTILIILITAIAVVVEFYQAIHVLAQSFRDAAITSFMVAVGLAISAVPEGLPAVVTITLAIGMRKMASKNAVVRRLSSVETLGSTTVISSDKTGTMTKNEMTVKEAYVNGETIKVTGTGYNPEGDFLTVESNPDGSPFTKQKVTETEQEPLVKMLRTFALCNNAELNHDEEEDRWYLVGDPTEGALLTFAHKGGIVKEEAEERYLRIHENPFDSARKMMSTVHKTPEKETVTFVKGAPEELLEYSSHILKEGKVKTLDIDTKRKILEKVESMSQRALRVLAAAYKPLDSENYKIENTERNLIFVGVAGMIDPPRENVKGSIELCRNAGIQVIMVTGDHLLTAEAIAKEIGLLSQDATKEDSLTGREVGKLTDEGLQEAVKNVKVFARVSPKDKVRIAEALKANGEIVAMTGDGVNDAPAVKRADIGVSMGIKGTEVTKEASDMVLVDDDFSTIVTAVREGRGLYGNIRKFLRYLLMSNFDEILLIGVAAFLVYPILPLTPIQILWINLATDGIPATALAFDTYEKGLMETGPRDPNEGLLHGMLLFVLVGAIMQFAASFLLFHFGLKLGWAPKEVNTMVFCEAVGFELTSVWNCRSERHSVWARGKENFKNKLFVLGVLINIPIMLAIVYFPPLQGIFGTRPLTFIEGLLVIGIATIGLLIFPEVLMRGERSEIELEKEATGAMFDH